ncbi:Transcriptional regulator, TetR family [Photobacterium marinum]|uniref:Transcriptional regulator, TetR family n=1 Tax=Photobacterium marinum TaxID=1056511 RepID=L8J9D1_9GAMM|nr:TetR/AcrR family transcriptional regulator [Photobacterium marinum]ELR64082.1 Transcriptional regulator, TetR family [Photobacterium marinum]
MEKSKKQRILDSALELFVNQGIQSTSTASIANLAGVATGTLFHHFSSKQALVLSLYSNIKQELSGAMQMRQPGLNAQEKAIQRKQERQQKQKLKQCSPQALRGQVQDYWQQALRWAQTNPDKLKFLQQIPLDPQFDASQHRELMMATMAFLVDLIKQGQEQHLLAPLPLELVLSFCHSHFLTCAGLFAEQPELAEQSDYQNGAFQILWQGLSPQTDTEFSTYKTGS